MNTGGFMNSGRHTIYWIVIVSVCLCPSLFAQNQNPHDPNSHDQIPLARDQGPDRNPSDEQGDLQEQAAEKGTSADPDPDCESKRNKTLLPDEAIDVRGFWEIRIGYRTQSDRYERDLTIGQTLFHLELEKQWKKASARLAGDLVSDYLSHVDHRDTVRLEKGEGPFDLREFNVAFLAADRLQIRCGRQMLKWGTGDLLFINDLFPKDWKSFYSGRDESYLRAPSDAVLGKMDLEACRLDVAYMPRFDADRYISGRRFSYYNRSLERLAGRDARIHADAPDDWFDDREIAVRLYRECDDYLVALYGYDGYWKSPSDPMPVSGFSRFPELTVFGASIEGDVAGGRGNVETGFYFSKEDRSGDNPWVNNDEFRALAGYRREVTKDFELGAQYYLERMLDYSDYRRSHPFTRRRKDKDRHVTALRATQFLVERALALSLFVAWSPSASDGYLRPNVHYMIDDYFSVELGANLFYGKHEETAYGQFEQNSNVYGGFRFRF